MAHAQMNAHLNICENCNCLTNCALIKHSLTYNHLLLLAVMYRVPGFRNWQGWKATTIKATRNNDAHIYTSAELTTAWTLLRIATHHPNLQQLWVARIGAVSGWAGIMDTGTPACLMMYLNGLRSWNPSKKLTTGTAAHYTPHRRHREWQGLDSGHVYRSSGRV